MSSKVVVLTGANRGLGLAMAEAIAARPEPINLVATSRSGADLGIKPSHPDSTVIYAKLDVTDQATVDSAAALVKEKYGRVDVVIANGGGSQLEDVQNTTFGPETVRKTFDLNYHGVRRVRNAFLPLTVPGSRFVYVGSGSSFQVKFDSPDLHRRVIEEQPTEEELNALEEEYARASESPEAVDGWLKTGFKPIYATSKAFVNLLAAADARAHPDRVFNVVCPGVVDTGEPPAEGRAIWKMKTPAQGARVPLRLAFDELDGANGKFFNGKSSSDTGPGEIVEDWPGKEIIFDLLEKEQASA